ncbi:MAG: deoxyribodipyrimidine photo-lyase [Candidatus Methanofastidiosia archaeon]|jgi:deoxyribodipyrimidine photo-lyase
MIHSERVTHLNSKRVKNGDYTIYWMQASHRTEYNHALEYAILRANELGNPLIVYFGLTNDFPEANKRHYTFMIEGLQEVQKSLEKRGIQFVIQCVSPEKGIVELSYSASLVVVDTGYVSTAKKWREYAAQNCDCPVIQVETNVVVPVEEASVKEEYSAATIRPKIEKQLEYYLVPVPKIDLKMHSLHMDFDSFDITDDWISSLDIDRTVNPVRFTGGTLAAKKHLKDFIKNKLDLYPELRNDPTKDYQSNMSPYLHFGSISPVYIALKILDSNSPGKDAYIEQLIVRRELSMNYVYYNCLYKTFEGLPDWPKKTLKKHEKDPREYIYTQNQLENAHTHDQYWNAAQKEMVLTGKMHGYMRMYWGKKILEWTETPEKGFDIALYLNNTYELDGRDPNGYTGVAWCFGKHDRPWKERPIFGTVRYMNARGLTRKFDADAYVEKIEHDNVK